uniref:Uncharacterized protein n=1 Tax=Sinocyclocheilus rhinocerous TaxID=307959 RepID=A0A673JKM2_9TELE
MELRRKDQSLRSLGKQLSQSQQENKQLQHDIASAENALTTVEMNKESLMSYMKSVEEHLQEMKDHVILSRRASSRNDFTLQLSRLSLIPSDLQRIVGNPETEACQVQTLTNHILQLSMQSSHITALKSELQDACLRERNGCIPVRAIPCLALNPNWLSVELMSTFILSGKIFSNTLDKILAKAIGL